MRRHEHHPAPPSWRTPQSGHVGGLALWCAVVAVALTSTPLERSGIHASPFYGRWEFHDLRGLLPALGIAVALVWAWPLVADRWNGVRLAVASGAASVLWATALALSGGVDRLWTPLDDRYGYLGVAPDLDARTFVRTFVERSPGYPTHVKGHPPGMPLLLRAMEAIGLAGPRWAAVCMLALWGMGVAAVTFAVGAAASPASARRASAAVAFLPGVVFVATTFDAAFAGVMATAIALLVVAARSDGRRADLAAVAGGLLAGSGLFLSYGLVTLGLVPLVVIVRDRRWRVAALAAFGVAVVVLAFLAAGFWWLDGLHATRGFYAEGISRFRPSSLFVTVVNPAALAICVGPFAAMAAGHGLQAIAQRSRADGPPDGVHRFRAFTAIRTGSTGPSTATILSAAALAAVTVANLSGLSNGETERIWLPFMPWLAVAGGAAGSTRLRRVHLTVLLGIGLAIQATLVTPW